MNSLIKFMFIAQIVICLLCAILAGNWQSTHSKHDYLYITDSPSFVGFIRFFTWYIIFSAFVPISLLVSMELVKFW